MRTSLLLWLDPYAADAYSRVCADPDVRNRSQPLVAPRTSEGSWIRKEEEMTIEVHTGVAIVWSRWHAGKSRRGMGGGDLGRASYRSIELQGAKPTHARFYRAIW